MRACHGDAVSLQVVDCVFEHIEERVREHVLLAGHFVDICQGYDHLFAKARLALGPGLKIPNEVFVPKEFVFTKKDTLSAERIEFLLHEGRKAAAKLREEIAPCLAIGHFELNMRLR